MRNSLPPENNSVDNANVIPPIDENAFSSLPISERAFQKLIAELSQETVLRLPKTCRAFLHRFLAKPFLYSYIDTKSVLDPQSMKFLIKREEQNRKKPVQKNEYLSLRPDRYASLETRDTKHNLIAGYNIEEANSFTAAPRSMDWNIFRNVQHLSLNNCFLSPNECTKILSLVPRAMPSLSSLNLSQLQVDSEPLIYRLIRALPSLEYLELMETNISPGTILLISRKFPRLKLGSGLLTACALKNIAPPSVGQLFPRFLLNVNPRGKLYPRELTEPNVPATCFYKNEKVSQYYRSYSSPSLSLESLQNFNHAEEGGCLQKRKEEEVLPWRVCLGLQVEAIKDMDCPLNNGPTDSDASPAQLPLALKKRTGEGTETMQCSRHLSLRDRCFGEVTPVLFHSLKFQRTPGAYPVLLLYLCNTHINEATSLRCDNCREYFLPTSMSEFLCMACRDVGQLSYSFDKIKKDRDSLHFLQHRLAISQIRNLPLNFFFLGEVSIPRVKLMETPSSQSRQGIRTIATSPSASEFYESGSPNSSETESEESSDSSIDIDTTLPTETLGNTGDIEISNDEINTGEQMEEELHSKPKKMFITKILEDNEKVLSELFNRIESLRNKENKSLDKTLVLVEPREESDKRVNKLVGRLRALPEVLAASGITKPLPSSSGPTNSVDERRDQNSSSDNWGKEKEEERKLFLFSKRSQSPHNNLELIYFIKPFFSFYLPFLVLTAVVLWQPGFQELRTSANFVTPTTPISYMLTSGGPAAQFFNPSVIIGFLLVLAISYSPYIAVGILMLAPVLYFIIYFMFLSFFLEDFFHAVLPEAFGLPYFLKLYLMANLAFLGVVGIYSEKSSRLRRWGVTLFFCISSMAFSLPLHSFLPILLIAQIISLVRKTEADRMVNSYLLEASFEPEDLDWFPVPVVEMGDYLINPLCVILHGALLGLVSNDLTSLCFLVMAFVAVAVCQFIFGDVVLGAQNALPESYSIKKKFFSTQVHYWLAILVGLLYRRLSEIY